MTGPGWIVRDGWKGAYPDSEIEGAIPNGARIRKVREEAGDATPLGTEGTVLASIGPITDEDRAHLAANEITRDSDFFYFVEWDTVPKQAVGIMGAKIDRA